MDELVRQEEIGPQLVLTLDDPNNRNALSENMAKELIAKVRDFDSSRELRLCIISGAGSAFCSGADLTDRAVHATSDVADHVPRRRRTIFDVVAQTSKPIIAAINGPAVGAGANLAMACDIRICANDAWMQWPQAKLGVLPGSGTLARLYATVGVSRALEWTLARTKVDALSGASAGLYNHTTSAEELLPTCLRLGSEICESAPLSVRFIKESLSQLVRAEAETTADADEYRSFILFNTRERKQASDEWSNDHHARGAQRG